MICVYAADYKNTNDLGMLIRYNKFRKLGRRASRGYRTGSRKLWTSSCSGLRRSPADRELPSPLMGTRATRPGSAADLLVLLHDLPERAVAAGNGHFGQDIRQTGVPDGEEGPAGGHAQGSFTKSLVGESFRLRITEIDLSGMFQYACDSVPRYWQLAAMSMLLIPSACNLRIFRYWVI